MEALLVVPFPGARRRPRRLLVLLRPDRGPAPDQRVAVLLQALTIGPQVRFTHHHGRLETWQGGSRADAREVDGTELPKYAGLERGAPWLQPLEHRQRFLEQRSCRG